MLTRYNLLFWELDFSEVDTFLKIVISIYLC